MAAGGQLGETTASAALTREMHVSPFMPMDQGYAWGLAGEPEGPARLWRIANHREGDRELLLFASLALRLPPTGLI